MSERGQTNGNSDSARDATLRAAPLRVSRRQTQRAAAAMRELTDPWPVSLSDRQRLTVERLCKELIGGIEDALRSLMLSAEERSGDAALDASLGAAHVPLAMPILEAAGELPGARIVGSALERSDMHEAARRLRKQAGAGDRIAALVGGEDSAKSSRAMALLIAESRANMRFDEPLLPPADLDPALREALIWKVAAALRHYALAHYSVAPETIDRLAMGAAAKLRDELAEETGLSEAARDLAETLGEESDTGLLADALAGGRLALYCALLGRNCDIDASSAWALVSDPAGVGHALLLRAASLERQQGADLVLTLLEALGEDPQDETDTPDWLAVWEELSAEAAFRSLSHWRVDAAYREALSAIGAHQPRPRP